MNERTRAKRSKEAKTLYDLADDANILLAKVQNVLRGQLPPSPAGHSATVSLGEAVDFLNEAASDLDPDVL